MNMLTEHIAEEHERKLREQAEKYEALIAVQLGASDYPLCRECVVICTKVDEDGCCLGCGEDVSTPWLEARSGNDECEHEWLDARNKAVKNGSICLKCMTLRPENIEDIDDD